MRICELTRTLTDDQGTIGQLVVRSEDNLLLFSCPFLELPWRNDETDLSCLPDGDYYLSMRWSPHHACDLYHIDGDHHRVACEIHAANLAGDIKKGYVAQLKGCGSPGRAVMIFPRGVAPAGPLDQRGVVNSTTTLAAFHAAMQGQAGRLKIAWAPGVGPA